MSSMIFRNCGRIFTARNPETTESETTTTAR
jgi:hypothetical protein